MIDQAEEPVGSIKHADHQPQSGTSVRVCLISLSGELFAIDLRNIREVFEVESITPVPGMPKALAGVANLGGTIIALADLRPMMGLPIIGPSPRFGVVIRHGIHQMGLLVDQVPEIRTVRADEFIAAPDSGSHRSRPFVSAILKTQERMSGVVEVPTLLAYVETESSQASPIDS
jgi:purine-binding chemotaxis protein CheW